MDSPDGLCGRQTLFLNYSLLPGTGILGQFVLIWQIEFERICGVGACLARNTNCSVGLYSVPQRGLVLSLVEGQP